MFKVLNKKFDNVASNAYKLINKGISNVKIAITPNDATVQNLNKVAHSYWFDWIGIAILFICAYFAHYFSETAATTAPYKAGSQIARMFGPGFLIGWFSLISAIVSLLSDRFESRMQNVGNWIGIPSIVMSAYTDYMYGNQAAFITYSVTMIIQVIAIPVWHLKGRYDVNRFSKSQFYTGLVVVTAGAFSLSLWSNHLLFGANAHGIIYWTTVLVFAISLIANVAEMFKIQLNNKAWGVYNVINLIKNLAQGNLVNVFKYIYYLGNTVVSLASWSDRGRSFSKHAEAKKSDKIAVAKL